MPWNCTKAPIDPPTQDVRLERNGKILWYFAVGDRSVYPADLEYYDVEHMASEYPDPYRFNTFGNLLESPDLKLKDGVLSGTGKTFDIRIHALTMQTPEDRRLDRNDRASRPRSRSTSTQDWAAHCTWWSDFWNRSWITVSDNTLPPERARSTQRRRLHPITARRPTAARWSRRATTSFAS